MIDETDAAVRVSYSKHCSCCLFLAAYVAHYRHIEIITVIFLLVNFQIVDVRIVSQSVKLLTAVCEAYFMLKC
jgi:hypothetical protein